MEEMPLSKKNAEDNYDEDSTDQDLIDRAITNPRTSWGQVTTVGLMPQMKNTEAHRHQTLANTRSNRNSHLLLMGMQKHTATLEDSLAISYKTKNIFLLERPAVGLPAISQRSGNVTPQKTCPTMPTAALVTTAKT